jgi:septum formation protein
MLESVPMNSRTLLLASSSPRRQQMLAWTGWKFRIQTADIDETAYMAELPGQYALRLAETKGRSVLSSAEPEELIVASDTIVADGEDLLGKPVDEDAAANMLYRLRGRTHQVYTALAVIDPISGRQETDLCVSRVPMRDYSDTEIADYIASGDPFDKAGGYAIQHAGFHPVTDFQDCYACVMGMPLCHLVGLISRFALAVVEEVPVVCQEKLGYNCAIFQEILHAGIEE